jgi:flagellar biosynthesis protein FlhF
MRLKSFHADSLSAALALVRETLGDDAIIVATQEEDESERGARVTAAIEDREDDGLLAWESPDQAGALETITEILDRHGTPRALTDKLVQAAADTEEIDVTLALAGALDRNFTFRALPDEPGGKPLMLIGPPGVGKTVTCAKIAARLAIAYEDRDQDPPLVLIAADPMRVGAVEQLSAYAERLGAKLMQASNASELSAALARCGRREMVVIDTPGTNPYDLDDLAYLIELAEAGEMEVVLVLGAGRDAEEAADIAKAFRPMEARRLLATGLDLSHRLGSLLAAADAGRLAFSDISRSPRIAHGLKPLNPLSLARLLLPDSNREATGATERADWEPSDRQEDAPLPQESDEASREEAEAMAALRAALAEARPRFGGDDD